MNPSYFDCNNVAVFTTEQLDIYGLPEENGFYDPYIVIDNAPVYQKSFSESNHTMPLNKPIHRYDRVERFQTCLKQLLGITKVIGKSVFEIQHVMHEELMSFERTYLPQCLMWNRLRSILHKHRLSAFYNRIPSIAQQEGMSLQIPVISKRLFRIITSDFEQMHDIFPKIRHKLQRKYFPNIRAMCLLLLERYDVPNVMMVPIARTPGKVIELRHAFNQIWDEINDEISTLIFDP